MILIKVLFLCSTCLITYANGGVVSFIDPCTPDDQDCILASSRKALPYVVGGLPELELRSSDPLIVGDIQALDGELKIVLRDMKVEGVKDCHLVNVTRNAAKAIITLIAECPFVATGKYVASGKLIVVPVEGNGPFSIKSDNIRIKATFKINTVDRQGKKYWTIVHRDIDFDPIEKVFLNFDNIFNGDKKKAEQIHNLLQQNWYELVTTVGKPIFKKVINKEVDNINKIISSIPSDELEKT